MAAATRMGVPLSVARGARLPGEPWTPRDWALAQAVHMLDQTRCHSCGQPTWLSHDKQLRRMWGATAERCFSCSAIESRKTSMGKDVHNPQSIHYRSNFLGH